MNMKPFVVAVSGFDGLKTNDARVLIFFWDFDIRKAGQILFIAFLHSVYKPVVTYERTSYVQYLNG